MTECCHSPVALSINCKRSFSEFDESSYLTPQPSNSWKRHCSGAHYFSPPPTPRGKRCAARRFVFDEAILSALALPELCIPEWMPSNSSTSTSQEDQTTLSPRFLLEPRFSYPSSHDIVFPPSLHRVAISTTQMTEAPSSDTATQQQSEQPPPVESRLSPVPKETEKEMEEAETLLMPPPPPVPTTSTTTDEEDDATNTTSPSTGKSHSDHHHHQQASAWRATLAPPEPSSRAGTEYARCA